MAEAWQAKQEAKKQAKQEAAKQAKQDAHESRPLCPPNQDGQGDDGWPCGGPLQPAC